MKIEQFEDKGLAQYSYAVLSDCAKEIVLIDPARDPSPYYTFARQNESRIIAVILTHSHADFVSSHAEIGRNIGAKIFVSSHMNAQFPHEKIDEGDIVTLGKITLKALYTPGHSMDSISILLEHDGKIKALFSGDTLFIGDVGRPDLRGDGPNAAKVREDLAREMYHTIHEKLKKLPEETIVYPGHGAGTLCGKSLSNEASSTIGKEWMANYAFQERSEDNFIDILLENQPFIPAYFGYDVELNKAGAPDLAVALKQIRLVTDEKELIHAKIIVDTRSEKEFKKGHINGAINIQNGTKFETWLGTIVSPKDKYYLIASDDKALEEVIGKAAKIGYELNIEGVFSNKIDHVISSSELDLSNFKENQNQYTIVDLRNPEEVDHKFFENSINVPLPQLRNRIKEIPTVKPIVVHCAGGYRSAIGSSLLQNELPSIKVYDLSENVKEFQS